MKKYLLGFSVIALIASNHAYGADAVRYDDVPAPASVVADVPEFSWAGGYLGAQAGGTWGKTDADAFYQDATDPDPESIIWSPDPSGFSGGIYAGYNFNFSESSGLVLGVETDFAWGNIDESISGSLDLDWLDLDWIGLSGLELAVNARIEQKWAGATRVRVAYATDRFLPYIAAGVAYAKVASSIGTPIGQGFELAIKREDTFTGWTVGTGVDYAMTDALLLRLEYRYSDYGDKTYTYDLTGIPDINDGDSVGYKINHKTHDVRVGVAYKF